MHQLWAGYLLPPCRHRAYAYVPSSLLPLPRAPCSRSLRLEFVTLHRGLACLPAVVFLRTHANMRFVCLYLTLSLSFLKIVEARGGGGGAPAPASLTKWGLLLVRGPGSPTQWDLLIVWGPKARRPLHNSPSGTRRTFAAAYSQFLFETACPTRRAEIIRARSIRVPRKEESS